MDSASNNFYLHVNGKWLNDPMNKIPDEYPRWGGFIKLVDESLKNQIKLVANLDTKPELSLDEQKILAIRNASSERFLGWARGKGTYGPVEKECIKLNALCDGDSSLAKICHYMHTNGVPNVFSFDVGTDPTNSNNVVLDFSVGGLSLPSRDYYLDDKFAEKRDLFRQHLVNVCTMLPWLGGVGGVSNFVNNVLEFEQRVAMCVMKQDQKRQYDQYYTNTTLTNLVPGMNNLRSLREKQENFAPEDRDYMMNEEQILGAMNLFEKIYELLGLRKVMADNLDKNFLGKGIVNPPVWDQVVAYDGDGLRRIVGLLLEPGMFEKYKSYVLYKIVGTLKAFCTKELDDEFFDFYGRKLNGQNQQKEEDKRTMLMINEYAGEILGKIYVEEYFPARYKVDVGLMVEEVTETMRRSLLENDWLTEGTKEKALQKLAKFGVKIGYPDVWKDYSLFVPVLGDSVYEIHKKVWLWRMKVEFYYKINSVTDRTEWHMTPQTVNAYFSGSLNEIVFPAAILQAPFYCKSLDEVDFDIGEEIGMLAVLAGGNHCLEAINLGGIGAVIAHEITHGYDDNGRKLDGDGNLNDWWSEEDAELFRRKTVLMAIQAEKYVFVGDDRDDGKEYRMNANLTMGENLADLGGMSLSLKTMIARFSRYGLSKEEMCAYQRILFKAYANIWKQLAKTDYKISALVTDPHAPPDFRANLVSNMGEFYEVFGVREGDRMWVAPENRVRMW